MIYATFLIVGGIILHGISLAGWLLLVVIAGCLLFRLWRLLKKEAQEARATATQGCIQPMSIASNMDMVKPFADFNAALRVKDGRESRRLIRRACGQGLVMLQEHPHLATPDVFQFVGPEDRVFMLEKLWYARFVAFKHE